MANPCVCEGANGTRPRITGRSLTYLLLLKYQTLWLAEVFCCGRWKWNMKIRLHFGMSFSSPPHAVYWAYSSQKFQLYPPYFAPSTQQGSPEIIITPTPAKEPHFFVNKPPRFCNCKTSYCSTQGERLCRVVLCVREKTVNIIIDFDPRGRFSLIGSRNDTHTHTHTHTHNKYHWSPLGRINASGIEWLGWQGRIARSCAI